MGMNEVITIAELTRELDSREVSLIIPLQGSSKEIPISLIFIARLLSWIRRLNYEKGKTYYGSNVEQKHAGLQHF